MTQSPTSGARPAVGGRSRLGGVTMEQFNNGRVQDAFKEGVIKPFKSRGGTKDDVYITDYGYFDEKQEALTVIFYVVIPEESEVTIEEIQESLQNTTQLYENLIEEFAQDRKSTRLNPVTSRSRMPSSA